LNLNINAHCVNQIIEKIAYLTLTRLMARQLFMKILYNLCQENMSLRYEFNLFLMEI